ncbi:Hypothetical predicted protein [Lynx pardinus]|uniref:Uncharacterized protein n=1 Tax=Lynx pardinus TaxID=191816 RepID=A0A485PF38_LYNPA|nr:Hypothetical predicted protein [Lynx pardinus]
MGLEVNEDDIQALVEEHGQETSTHELMDLHRRQQQEVMGDISSAEEEGGKRQAGQRSRMRH